MSHPREEELVDLALLLDVADPSVPAHAEGCAECSAAVAQLRRTAELVSALPTSAGWQAPPDAVWSRITDEIDADEIDADDMAPVAAATDDAAVAPTPFTSADRTAATRAPDRARRHTPAPHGRVIPRRRAAGWGALLAAASLAVGLLAGRAVWQPAQTPAGQDVSQVALATLDTKQDEGRATVVRSGSALDLTVDTTKALDEEDGYLEVWLLNKDGRRMVSIGVLAPGGMTFPITQRLIDEGYVIVDISREPFDEKAAHSGNSLLRGQLPA